MQHVSCQHFRTEFVRQSQATILRKVTMTQFMLVLLVSGVGMMVLNAPIWTLPLWIALGYVAGYSYNGEFVHKRVRAYVVVWVRLAIGRPRIINVQQEWEQTKAQATNRKRPTLRAAVTLVESRR